MHVRCRERQQCNKRTKDKQQCNRRTKHELQSMSCAAALHQPRRSALHPPGQARHPIFLIKSSQTLHFEMQAIQGLGKTYYIQQEGKRSLSHYASWTWPYTHRSRLRVLLSTDTQQEWLKRTAASKVDQVWKEGRSPERPKLGFMKLVLNEPDLRDPIGDVPMMLSSSTV